MTKEAEEILRKNAAWFIMGQMPDVMKDAVVPDAIIGSLSGKRVILAVMEAPE